MSLVTFALVLLSLVVAVCCWLVVNLVRQSGRLLLRLEAIEHRLAAANSDQQAAPAQQGLPIGSIAPDFELPDLSGTAHKLSDWDGQRRLLIFFNPGCGYCVRMAGDLAALPIDGADGRPVPIVVTAGTVESNQKMVDEHGIRGPVLRQQGAGEIASLYEARGTPMGYLIDEAGSIASPIAIGADAVLALAKPGAAAPSGRDGDSASGAKGKTYQGNRTLAESRINRSGLTAGTTAPPFTLPRVDDGEISLESYRGRRVLVVFSAPDCKPCCDLAPHLEQFHNKRGDVDVLMVSRGDVDANRKKIKELALTLPVVLQRQWEISKEYGIFATPVAYLIDENGVTLRDVAVGVDPILSLMSSAAAGMRAGAAGSTQGKEGKALTH